jgi:hypothetical protein
VSKLFFLIFFATVIVSSENESTFTFKRVDNPSDIQLGVKPSLEESNWKNTVKELLDKQAPSCEKIAYAFDFRYKTAACVQEFKSKYQIVYSDAEGPWIIPVPNLLKNKPLHLGITNNIMVCFYEDKEINYFRYDTTYGHFSSFRMPFDNSKSIFDEFIGNHLHSFSCLPGNSGNLYLQDDQVTYLLTLKNRFEGNPINPLEDNDSSIGNQPKKNPKKGKEARWLQLRRRVFFWGLMFCVTCVGLVFLIMKYPRNFFN